MASQNTGCLKLYMCIHICMQYKTGEKKEAVNLKESI